MNKSSSPLDFIDIDELQAIQDSFARTVNISSIIVYPDGEPLTRFTNPTGFCSLIQSTEKGKQRCVRSFMEMSKKALEFKEPQIFYCFAHGGHFVAPIIINGEHKATMFAGQFISQSFSASQLEELEKIAVEINVDPVQLIEKAKQMRVIDKDVVWNNANLIFQIEKMITRLGMQAFELQKAHDQQEVLVQERTAELMNSNEELKQEIIERKRIEEALQKSDKRYKSLFENMKSGVAIYETVDDGNDFVFKDFNTAGEKIDSINRKDIIGKRVTEAFPGVKNLGLFEVFQRVWRTGESEFFPEAMYKDEHTTSWRENFVYKLPSGEIVAVYDDVTKRKYSEKIEAAYTDILTIANRTLDLHTIVSEGLDSLMKYIDAQAGAIYLYDPDHKMMMPNVIRGMKKVVAKQEFSPGEGIAGETGIKQEMIVLTSVLEDTIYTIKSGSDRIIPTTIVSTPMIFKGMLLGVVITCHTTNVPPKILSFIKRVIDQYAVAVNNANTFIQVQEMAASLKNQRDELEIRSHELEAASRTKSEFLANMSHELRTPLNSIIGFSEILHDGTFGPLNEKQTKYISNVLVSGKHLLELINGILDLAKVESGKMELTCEDFNVCAVIEESVMLLSSVALKKNIKLNTAVDEELTTINADMGKFRQILYNLMSNAIKFTPNGGSVTVEGRYNRDMAQIAVIDTGIGISKEDQDKLFNPFVQLDSSLSRVYEGTGLGLVLVKRFVEMHGGKIWIKSEPDRGSKFIFTIPIKSSLTLGIY